jgi:ubiquinone biosynthesis protein Coq4
MTMLGDVFSSLRAIVAFARVVRDPDRLTEVFRFIDHGVANRPSLTEPVVAALRATERGERALRERPRLGPVDLGSLARLPSGSLGAAFAAHARANRIDPAALPVLEAKSEVEWAVAHLYETHDLWHVLTGFGTDRAGELGLQAFYLAQLPSRVAQGILAIGAMNSLLFDFDDHAARMEAIAHGWTLGRRAAPLAGLDWAALWERPLAELREELRLSVH